MFAIEQGQYDFRKPVDPIDQVLGQLQLSGTESSPTFQGCLGKVSPVVGHHEAAHRHIAFGQLQIELGATHIIKMLDLRNGPANHHPCRHRSRDVEQLAADIVEERVD